MAAPKYTHTGKQFTATVEIKDNLAKALEKFPGAVDEATREALDRWENIFYLYMDRATKWWLPTHVPYWDIKKFHAAQYHVWEMLAFTVSLPYLYVDLGTEPHDIDPKHKPYLKFREDYLPHLGVGDTTSRESFYYGDWVLAQHVDHPGIAAREVTENMMKNDVEPDFEPMLEAVLAKWQKSYWEKPYTEVKFQY